MKSIKLREALKKMLCVLAILFFTCSTCVLAADDDADDSDYDFWEVASEWYSNGGTNTYLSTNVVQNLADIVEIVGTSVIAIATVVLGVKYILGSVTEKVEVKESMATLLVACLFFFGWSSLRDILLVNVEFDAESSSVTAISGESQLFIFKDGTDLTTALASVFSLVIIIAKLVAIVATVYMGVKYIFSGSEGKAKLKEKGFMYLMGIILIFTTLNILTFISNGINDLIM